MSPLSHYWKVPRRQVYCHTLRSWIREVLWIFVVLKFFRADIDAIRCRCAED